MKNHTQQQHFHTKRAYHHAWDTLFALSFLFAHLLLTGCAGKQAETIQGAKDGGIQYAQLLKIEHADSFTVCDVMDAWNKGRTLHRYILIPRSAPMPTQCPKGTVVRTPLERAVAFTSVHGSLLCDLGAMKQLCGVCDYDYIMRPELRQAVTSGKLANMGMSTQPDLEKMIASHADALLVSPFQNASYGGIEKLNIPLIECADYMEATPLGRAEWMRFFGLLFGREATADSLFKIVEKNYTELTATVQKTTTRPTLLIDQKQGGAWYVPGGKSYLGSLYKDAGANYCFANNAESGSVSLSFETVFQKAHAADLWLIKSGGPTDLTYKQLQQDFAPNAQFKAFQEHHIWYCNSMKVPYFEEAPFHPDFLLKDLIKIFHPEILPDYQTRYFFPMK